MTRKKREPWFAGISGVRPEGGHQDPEIHHVAYQKLSLPGEPPRCMYPDELVTLVVRNRHPRFHNAGIACTRFGSQPRKDVGMAPHGTAWFATNEEREWTLSIRCDCIPYSTIKTGQWDDAKMRWVSGEVVRGWRSFLEQLTEQGFLYPSEELDWYTRKHLKRQTHKCFGGYLSDAHFEDDASKEAFERLVQPYIRDRVVSYGNDEIAELAVAHWKNRGGYKEVDKEVKVYG